MRKRKDGRREGRYTAGYDPKTGKRIIKNVLGKTQAEVKEKLKKTLKECQGLNVSRTEEYYELIIETYTIPRIGDIRLKKLTTRHLQKLYKKLFEGGRIQIGKAQVKGLSITTVHSVHLMLHAALERAVKERQQTPWAAS